MSAIWGIINKNGKPVEPEMVQKIQHRMQHRATNGSKTITCDNAAFGFCHLIVYPNQEHEQLPVEEGDLVFTANAHLHNRDELLHKLGFDKKQHEHTPDSYLILAAYKHWGEACVHHLDGEYVYAVWNKVSKELFISNDHIGFKALYYYDTPEQFIFCSEIKGIEAVKETPNYFDTQTLLQYFYKQGVPASTYNLQIKRLINATVLLLNSKVKLYKYWQLQQMEADPYRSPEESYSCFRELFSEAVKKRVARYGNNGITLSGGLDSGAISMILSEDLRKQNQSLYAFSSILPDEHIDGDDELEFIKVIAESCQNVHLFTTSGPDQATSSGVAKGFEMDESFPNPFFYMDVALLEAARSQGVTVLYTGYGGDYWASSPGRQVIIKLLSQLKYLSVFRLLIEISNAGRISIRQILKQMILSPIISKSIRRIRKKEKSLVSVPLQRQLKRIDRSNFKEVVKMVNEGYVASILGMLDNRNESFSMASAVPFFDRNILQFLVSVPLPLFYTNGITRAFFRNSMKGVLPERIRTRKTKTPYVPNYWKRNPLSIVTFRQLLNQEMILAARYLNTAAARDFETVVDNKAGGVQFVNAIKMNIVLQSFSELKKSKYYFP